MKDKHVCSATTGLALGFVGGLSIVHMLQLDDVFILAAVGALALGLALLGLSVQLARRAPRLTYVWYLTAPAALALFFDTGLH